MRKAKTILRSRSGASMMFVLAAMLLLWWIGASALNAATENAGAGNVKRTQNQLELYANSMELTLKSLVEQSETAGLTSLDSADTLVGQILKSIYQAADASADGTEGSITHFSGSAIGASSPVATFRMTLNPALSSEIPSDISYNIAVRGHVSEVQFTRFKDYVPAAMVFDNYYMDWVEISPAEPRVPQEVLFSGGEIIFTVTTTWTPPGGGAAQTVITESTYRLVGTVTIGDGTTAASTGPFEPAITDMTMASDSWGRVFHKHEKIDR